MSQEYAWPHSGRAGLETAAAPVARARRPLRDFEPALGLAGLGQAFDACVMGVLALAVFPQLFFANLAPQGALAAAVAVWGLAYAVAWTVRPAVAWLDRRHDPRVRVALGRALFTAGCLAIAALPIAHHGPQSAWLLVLARVAQGLGIAGVAHGRLAPQIAAGEERRSRLRGWALAGGFAALAAGGILTGLVLALPRADFLAWGWRYPFVAALALNLVALFGDLLVERARDSRRHGRAVLRLATVAGVRVGGPT
jgi:MFS family permease